MKKFFRAILIITNIVMAVSMLLAYLCCYINPKTLWWISFFGLAFTYLLAANLCFVIFWLISRKKKLALISLIPILGGCMFIWRHFQLFEKKLPEDEKGNSVKVLTYNVHMFNQCYIKQPNGPRLNIFDYLCQTGADIICMQEFVSTPKVEVISEQNIRKRLSHTPYCHYERTMEDYGIATYSAYPIVRKQLFYSDNSINACMFTDLLIDGDTVRVYNVHLKSIGFNAKERDLLNNAVKKEYSESDMSTLKDIIHQMISSSFRRAQQVETLVAHIAKSPYPVIVCGDFNDPPTSYSYQKVRGKRKDAFIEAGSGRSTTYNIGRISSQRIDYVLYSDVFKAYDYESPRIGFSDHFPVTCRLKMYR